MSKVFITGGNGFVGKSLVPYLRERNAEVVEGTRELYGDFSEQKNWQSFLDKVDIVVHLAARVHVMNETEENPDILFNKMNVDASLSLARASKASGVKRFIYLSSIKVNGEQTFNHAFTAADVPNPEDAYGRSKALAEKELLNLHEPGVFEVVIIRPPLIYGPGVKANFEKLMIFVHRDLPLPFGLVKNKRSLVSVLNLCDLIFVTLTHQKAAGEIFLVKDSVDYSLRELIVEIAKIKNKTPHLLPVPVSCLSFVLRLLGKKSVGDRIFGNLHVDITKNKELLDWTPPYIFKETF